MLQCVKTPHSNKLMIIKMKGRAGSDAYTAASGAEKGWEG